MSIEAPEDGWKHQAAVISPDGTEHIITGELAVMFDLLIGSMNWGSDMFDEEERKTIVKVGLLCGFEIPRCEHLYLDRGPDETGRHMVEKAFAKCVRHDSHEGLHQGPARARGEERFINGRWVTDPSNDLGPYMWDKHGTRVIDAQLVKTLPLEA